MAARVEVYTGVVLAAAMVFSVKVRLNECTLCVRSLVVRVAENLSLEKWLFVG